MRALFLYMLFTYIALSVQAIFFKGTKPDAVLVLICFYSLKYGHKRGITYGALSGLLIDTVSGFVLGPHVISKSIAGFIIGTIKEQLYQCNMFISTMFVAVFSVVNILLVYLLLETFSTVSLVNRTLEISVMEIIYTIITAMLLYPFLRPDRNGAGN